ncbi:hypothetical protein D9M70_453840 [compost metagenome]
MPDQVDAAGRHFTHVQALHIAGVGLWPDKLQQPVGQLLDAPDLLVDQPQLMADRLRGRAQDLARHVQVALDHGNRVVDLMGHAGGELSRHGELFRRDQLLPGRPQDGVGFFQLAGAFGHLAIERVRPVLELGVALLQVGQQLVELAGKLAQLVFAAHRAYPCPGVAGLERAHGADHPRHRRKHAPGPQQGKQRPRHAQQQEQAHQHAQRQVLGLADRLGQVAYVEHADALAAAVSDRLIGAHVPVVDHEGQVQPFLAAQQHLVAYLARDPRAQRALAMEQPHIGGDARVVQEQGGRALAAAGQ